MGVAAVGVLIALFGLWSAGHLGGTYWDSDEGINLMKARMVQLGFELYREVWADQPPGLTLLLAGAFDVLEPTVAVARGLVLAVALVGLAGVAWVTREAGGGWPAAAAAVALTATAPNFFWASRAVMIGLPALALATVAVGAALAYLRTGRRSWLAAAGLLLGASLAVKLIGAYLAVPFGLAILLRRGTRREVGAALRAVLLDGALFAVAAIAPLAVLAAVLDAPAMFDQVVGTVLRARGVYLLDVGWNADKLRFWTLGHQLPLAALAAYGALALAVRRTPAAAVVLAWGATTLAALLFQTPLWPKHHFLALLVVLGPLAGLGVEDLARRATAARRSAIDGAWLVVGATALTVAIAGAPGTARALAERTEATPYKESGKLPQNDAYTRQEEARRLVEGATEPDDFIVTDYHMIAFTSGRRLPPELCVVSGKRMAVAELTTEDVIEVTRRYRPAAILFWSGDRLQRLDGYRDWVVRHYRLAGVVADDFELFVPHAPAGP